MDDQRRQLRDLLRVYRKHVELEQGFGVEFVARSGPIAKPAAPASDAQPHTAGAATPGARRADPQYREPPAGGSRQARAAQREHHRNAEAEVPTGIPPEPEIPPNDIFEELREEVASCRKCQLCKARTHTVFGEGDPTTDLVFVGEGPGADEDRSGRPFVGRAGVQLTKIIQNGMKLPRSSVYIGNIIKCRPPGNRPPSIMEMAICRPYLLEQLRTIRPKVIVALGATAVQGLLGEKVAITKLRGTFREWEGVKVMPTFHPSYLVRKYTRETRWAVWQDMKAVMRYLREQGSPLAREE